jgi:hypothetical protein
MFPQVREVTDCQVLAERIPNTSFCRVACLPSRAFFGDGVTYDAARHENLIFRQRLGRSRPAIPNR